MDFKMRMKNADVIENFVRGMREAQSHTGNLYIMGNKLINYNTTIAQWENGRIILNKTSYSRTTSVLQNKVHYQAHNPIVIDNVPFDTYDLKQYVQTVA